MAMLDFDASTVVISHDPVKAGTYEAVITDSSIKATKNGLGKGLNLTFEIVSGENKGQKVWEWINIQHPSAEAQRIGQEDLAKLCKALNITRLTDTEQLHNKPLMITVQIDKNDSTRNTITRYQAKEETALWMK